MQVIVAALQQARRPLHQRRSASTRGERFGWRSRAVDSDYGADTIYIWDDPNGKRVETSVTASAINGGASQVTLRGLIVEKFATPSQRAAVNGGAGWLVEGNEFRLNHSRGLNMADGRRVLNNRFYRNGQLGLWRISRAGRLVEGNEISYNNFAGFNDYWEGGGSKFTFSRTSIDSRQPRSPQLRTRPLDRHRQHLCDRATKTILRDMERAGIFHGLASMLSSETTWCATTARRSSFTYWVEGAGISITTSKNVQLYGKSRRSTIGRGSRCSTTTAGRARRVWHV